MNGPITISSLSKRTMIPESLITTVVFDLVEKGLIKNFNSEQFEITRNQRLNLAILSLKNGVGIERVCQAVGWREFEDLVALILEENAYQVITHFRFHDLKRRHEIDVLGSKSSLILAIECKHWKQNWKPYAITTVVQTQMKRTQALALSLPQLEKKLHLKLTRELKLMPVVATLSDTPFKILNKIPVVPIFHLNNFLTEMHGYTNELMIVSIQS